ncbi:MAG: 30S ribosomal protein S4e [Candidatus Aenigmatarchaeota archaeon]
MTRLKRVATAWAMEKKEKKFIMKPRGSHKRDESMPLLVIIRDVLKLGDSAREARQIINGGNVLLDGKKVRNVRQGVGLFDTLSVAGKNYRMLPGVKMRLVEIEGKEADRKICKIAGKKTLRGGRTQLNLHDGRNIIVKSGNYSVNDSLLIKVPSQEIIGSVKFEPGATVMVISGKHSGRIAKLEKVEKGLLKRAWLEIGGEKTETPLKLVVAVGKEEPLIRTA